MDRLWNRCCVALCAFLPVIAEAAFFNGSFTVVNNEGVGVVNVVLRNSDPPSGDNWGINPNTIGAASSQGYTVVNSTSSFFNDFDGPFYIRYDVPGVGTFTSEESVSLAQLDGATFNLGSPFTSCIKVLPVTNDDIVPVRVSWILDGVVQYSEDLQPGQTRSHTITPPDCDNYTINIEKRRLVLTSDFELIEEGIDLDEIVDSPGDETINNTTGLTQGPQISEDLTDPSNNPVDWGTGQTEQETLQQGFSSLIYDNRANNDLELGLLDKIATNVAVLQYEEIDQNAMRNGFSGESVSSSNALQTLGGQFGSISTTIGGTDPHTILQIPIAGTSVVIDADPMSNPSTASIFTWIRLLFKWLITIWLVVACFRILREQINTFVNSPQIKLASKTPIVGAAISVFTITAIAGIIAAGVTLISSATIFGTYLAELLLQPFQNPTGIVSYAVWLLNKIFPLAYAIAALNAWFIYEMAASAITVGVSLAIRAVAFCLPFVLLSYQTQAGSVHLDNWTGNDIAVGGYVVPPGQHKLILPDGPYSIIDGTNSTTITVDGDDIFRSRQVFYSGSTLTLSTTTLDQEFDLFWIGFTIGLGVWALWFGMNWVKRIGLDHTNYD
jgi:hypothetical protein